MNDFERGFTEELAKIAVASEGYSDEEAKRLRQIMQRDVATGKKARKGLMYGAPIGLLAGTGIGALAGRKSIGALTGAGIGAMMGFPAGAFAGQMATMGKQIPELMRLSDEARKIHEGKTPEQQKKMMQAVWKGVPKR